MCILLGFLELVPIPILNQETHQSADHVITSMRQRQARQLQSLAAAAGQASVSSEPKLIYKKSVFKKKSTSSTATVSTTFLSPFSI